MPTNQQPPTLPTTHRRKRRLSWQRQHHWVLFGFCVLLSSSQVTRKSAVSAKSLRATSSSQDITHTSNNTDALLASTVTTHEAYAVYAATRRKAKVRDGRHHHHILRRPKLTVRKGRPQKVPRDLLRAEPRIVGGSPVNDLDKHPYFAEWHNQFCGGAVR